MTSFPSSLAQDPFAGTRYRALRQLGEGGMGQVYLVEHEQLGRQLVAKLVHPRLGSDPRFIARARLEARALGKLKHPHIVSITGLEETRDGRPFILMEYLNGRTLSSELAWRAGAMPVLEALTCTCELLSALAAAHEIGIVHRDIKPDNLFICHAADGSRYLKILDFGVIRVVPGASIAPLPTSMRTATGAIVGTPRWNTPEGAIGQRVDPRADLYAAAHVLYVMLAGRGPFDDRQSEEQMLNAHAFDDPERPSHYAKDSVPLELDFAVMKALNKNPEERFQTALEFKAYLEHVAAQITRSLGELATTAVAPELLSGPHTQLMLREPEDRPLPSNRRSDRAPESPLPVAGAVAIRAERSHEEPGGLRTFGLSRSTAILLFLLAVILTSAVVFVVLGLLVKLQGSG